MHVSDPEADTVLPFAHDPPKTCIKANPDRQGAQSTFEHGEALQVAEYLVKGLAEVLNTQSWSRGFS